MFSEPKRSNTETFPNTRDVQWTFCKNDCNCVFIAWHCSIETSKSEVECTFPAPCHHHYPAWRRGAAIPSSPGTSPATAPFPSGIPNTRKMRASCWKRSPPAWQPVASRRSTPSKGVFPRWRPPRILPTGRLRTTTPMTATRQTRTTGCPRRPTESWWSWWWLAWQSWSRR